MDPFNRRSSGTRRKPVQRSSLRLSDPGSDDEDSYDLAAATVADGFRPTNASPVDGSSSPTINAGIASPASSQAQLLSQSPTDEVAAASTTSKPARPSSAIKPPRPHDSLTLRGDGTNSLPNGPSLPTSSTDALHLRPQSPYRGPTGPSHPYQMYLQRTLSDAPGPTDQPATRLSYDGPRPAHPYALYPQNTVTTGDETPTQIPLGFVAAGDGYQRQIGPDGEEAGVVGPLGHTEELPPYSRYPDQPFVPKVPATTEQEGNAAANVADQTITGAGGIGVATRNPEFSSTEEDLQPSQSRPSTRSHHDINTAAQSDAEKPAVNKWQLRAKKRLWGIVPYWAICLLFIGVILIGVILGAVIGTVLSHHKSSSSYPPPPYFPQPTPTPTSDVVPLPYVPNYLPRLPVGPFELPPLIPSQAPKTCFNQTTQAAAWSCNMPFSYYEMSVGSSPKEKDTECYNLTLKAVNPVDAQFLWGTQPPSVFHETMTLVNDTFEPRRGPAWWLKVKYDKIVVVAEDSFTINNNNNNNNNNGGNGGNNTNNNKRWNNLGGPMVDYEVIRAKAASIGAKNGDRPWICTWPGTTLEIFIYPVQNSSASPNPTSGSKTQSTSSTSSVPNPYPTDGLHAYPKTVKFLERRVSSDSPKAFCRQVQIIDNGHGMKNLTDPYGNPIQFEISENVDDDDDDDSSYKAKRQVRRGWSQPYVSRELYELTPCGCLWWAT